MAERGIRAPLRRPTFRAIWTAAAVSNVGTWMHDTAAVWTMATLAPTPLMVSLMQTATSFPFFAHRAPRGACDPGGVSRQARCAPACATAPATSSAGGKSLL